MFGSSTWGQNNQQQQQQGQQGGGLFGSSNTGGFGQQNTGGFGQSTGGFGQPQQQQSGGLFGSGNTGSTGFGSGGGFGTNTQQNNAFGQARPTFGATGTSTFGSTNNTTGGVFGSNNNTTSTFGAQPAQSGGLFGARPATTTSTFGTGTTSNLFGARPANSPFGASNTATPNLNTVQPYSAGPFPAPPPTGTAQPAYQPTWQQDPSATAGASSTLPPHLFHVISAMEPYKGASWEELRVMDYQQNRKDASSSAQAAQPATGGFGQPTSTFGQPSGSTFGQQPAASTSTFGAPKPGGLFGSSGTTGFGNTSGGFGSTGNTGGGLFGQQNQQNQSSPFGAQPQTQQSGGLFGQQNQQQPQSGGLFGSSNTNTNTGGGLFGSTQTNQQNNTFGGGFGQNKPAFGSTGTTGGYGTTSTNTFGQPAQNSGTSSFTFGQNNPQQPQQSAGGLFGQTNTQNTNTGGGLFGSSNTQQNQQPQSGGLFGTNNAAKPGGLFGSTQPAATGGNTFGGFGQNNTTQPASGGLFGSTNQATTGQTGGLFGQQPAQQQPTQQPSTGGLFGNTGGSSLFGAKPATTAPTGGLFGASQPAAQPAQQGSSLFGNAGATQTGGGLFGSTNNTFGQQNQQQNQQKPSLFGGGGLFGSTTQQQPAAQSGGLFGSTTQNQPATTSLFGAQPQQNTQPALGGSLFGANQSATAPQPSLTASIDQNPYGRNELFNYTGQKLELGSSTKKPALPPLTSSTFRVTPTKSQLNKLRGFSSPLTSSQSPGRVSSPLNLSTPGRVGSVSSPSSNDRYRGLTDTALTPNAFVPRPSIKKLTVHPKSNTLNGEDHLESILGKSAIRSPNGTPKAAASPQVNGIRANSSRGESSLRMSGSERIPKTGEYWCKPRLEKLRQLGHSELKAMHNFTVGRKGYGEVTFLEPVDLTAIDLNDLFGSVIVFNDMELAVYPDDYKDKPPRGEGLNQPARVSLENCWPKDKATKQPITDMSDPRHARFLKRVKTIPETEFVSYTDDGVWTFKVEHFSRYGIDDDEESETASPAKSKRQQAMSPVSDQTGSGTGSGSGTDDFHTDGESDESDEFLPPTRGLRDDETEDSEESTDGTEEHSMTQTEASSLEDDDVLPPPPTYQDGIQAKLGADGIRKLKEMQASMLFQQDLPKRTVRSTEKRDFEQAEGDSVALDRATKRASFGVEPAKPEQLRVPRKYSRVELTKGSVQGNEVVKVDAGLGLGRSFRASWGPNGQLVHMGKICRPNFDSCPPPQSAVFIQQVELVAESSTDEIRNAERLLALHLERTEIELVNGIPMATLDPTIRFKDFSRLFDAGDRSHNANVWRLCVALFDEIDLRLPADTDDSTRQQISEIRRKLALTRWLEDAVAPSVDHDLLSTTNGAEKAFVLLSGNQLERAVQTALDNKDMRLATLISQIGGSSSFREQILHQLEDWKKYKATPLIGQAYRRIYALLAGIVDCLPGDKSRGIDGCPDVIVSDNLDWKRAFGLRLWFGNPFEDTIGDVLQSYTSQLGDSHPPAKPLPPHLESPSDLSRTWQMGTEPTDILFGLIRLYSDVGVSLDQVLRARDCSPSPLDARLQWHLYMLLSRVLQKRDFEDRDADYSATADAVTSAYAAQLETLGLWKWSAFIYLHLETSEGRENALRALLHRHPESSSDDKTFLTETLHVPMSWIAEADAAELAAEDEPYLQHLALIEAGQYDAAHRILVDKLASEIIIRGDNFLLRRLLWTLANHEVAEWEYGGKLLLDYLEIVGTLPTILADTLRSAIDVDGARQRRLEELTQAIPRVITLLPSLFPRKDDVQSVAALGEMLSNIHQLARQVHLAGYIDRPAVAPSVLNADRLHLLQTSAFDTFERSLTTLPTSA